MESNSFSHLHLITKPGVFNDLIWSGNISNSFIFNVESNEQVDTVFRYIFSKENNRPFSISISVNNNYEESDMKSWLNKLYLILCHPLYLRDNGKLIIGILSDNSVDYLQQNAFKQLTLGLSNQSFNVSFINFNQPGIKNANDPVFYFKDMKLSDEEFQQWYLNNLEKSGSELQIFILQNKEIVNTIIQKIEKTERKILEETPLVYKIIYNEVTFSTRKKELELTIENLKQDLVSKKEYLNFLLGKNADGTINGTADLIPSMKIKKFYHQEYEVLPLWYKRIGHIIKVLTGKRTFRSLYDNKAPKYKQ